MSRPDTKKNVLGLVHAYGKSHVLRNLANLVLVLVRMKCDVYGVLELVPVGGWVLLCDMCGPVVLRGQRSQCSWVCGCGLTEGGPPRGSEHVQAPDGRKLILAGGAQIRCRAIATLLTAWHRAAAVF
jgi:hypothetical protein